MGERVHRSIVNVRVGLLFYLLSLFLAFFSRKVFLDCLGAEFIGLTGTLSNILNFLNVAELGIGTGITYFLYKPLQSDNKQQVNEIMSVLAYLYRMIGIIICVAGLSVSLAFPFIFEHQEISLPLIHFTFYSFLCSSALGYILNYKQLLVSANQRQFLVNICFQTIGILQSLTQIAIAWYYQNLYLYVVVGLIYTILGCIIFNSYIDRVYPWLKVEPSKGRALLKVYPDILKKSRQVFVQRIKDFILYRSDQMLVFMFVSLKMVAFYDNYMIIVNKFIYLVNILSDGMNAGIGNLIAEGNKKNTMKVFWELTAIRFIILGVILFSFLLFIQPFVCCWIGEEYLLENLIVYLIVINLFIMLSRGVVEMYISACGLFGDVWAAWTELALNLIFTFALAPFLGIKGILLGKIISIFFIALFWKPYYLFTHGLHERYSTYWRGMLPYYLIFFGFIALSLCLQSFTSPLIQGYSDLFLYGCITLLPLLLVYLLVLYLFTSGMKYFVARLHRR